MTLSASHFIVKGFGPLLFTMFWFKCSRKVDSDERVSSSACNNQYNRVLHSSLALWCHSDMKYLCGWACESPVWSSHWKSFHTTRTWSPLYLQARWQKNKHWGTMTWFSVRCAWFLVLFFAVYILRVCDTQTLFLTAIETSENNQYKTNRVKTVWWG